MAPASDDPKQFYQNAHPVGLLLGRLLEASDTAKTERAELREFNEAQREVNAEHSRLLRTIGENVAALTSDKGRLADVEAGVADWRKTKGGALKVVAGVGLGGSIGGAGVGHFVSKLWERIIG